MNRNPSIELYHVLLMFGIVSLHTLCAAGLGFSPLARWLAFCVDGFVFISGWYGIKFGWMKVAKLYGLTLWCAAIVAFARWTFFENVPWSTTAFGTTVIKSVGGYWFVNAYIVLMCFAPIVNAALESKQTRKIFIPILLVIFGWSFVCDVPRIGPWIPGVSGFGSHTFFTLLGVYIVARIARLDHWDEKLSTKNLIVAIVILSLLAFCNLNKYNSPVAVLLGGTLFVLFSRMTFFSSMGGVLSALITLIAPSMLAVYLLHGGDFVFIRWGLSHFHNPWGAYAIVASAVFAVCVGLDLLRRGALNGLKRSRHI